MAGLPSDLASESGFISLQPSFLSEAPLVFYPVSREVNNVHNEHSDLIRPAPVKWKLF
jgi:hypothetical protein